MSSPLESFNLQKKDRWNILSNIPAWEQYGILSWIEALLIKEVRGPFGETQTRYQMGVLTNIQRVDRIMFRADLGIAIESWTELKNALRDLMRADDERFIIFLELMVKYVRDGGSSVLYNSDQVANSRVLMILESRLQNGSRWKVIERPNSPAGLIERVDSKITDVAIALDNRFVDEAWELAYRLKPDPEKAIEKIQSAVEAAASKNGLTTADTKVYGAILGDIKTRKSKSYQTISKKEFDLSRSLGKGRSGEQDPNDMFTDWFWMGMDLIQKSNPVRHKSEATADQDVSEDTAKQAVLIGTLIIQLITAKYIFKTKIKKLEK